MANVDGTAQPVLLAAIAEINSLNARVEDLMEKLDADAGITDTDYEATVGNRAALTVNNVTPALPT